LKKYGNFKFNHLFIEILFFTAGGGSADAFHIVFHELNFGRTRLNGGIEVLI